MANKRIRVYELARELGLSNKEALDLCERLRIGVKSHSSSIEDPQADRVRRLADTEGLRREVQPEEHEGAPAPVAEAPPAQREPDLAPAPEPISAPHRVIRSTEGGSRLPTRSDPPPPPRPVTEQRPPAPAEPAPPPMPRPGPEPIAPPPPRPAAPSRPPLESRPPAAPRPQVERPAAAAPGA